MNNQNIVCPSCGSKPIKGIFRKDGGSSECSNKNCNEIFHYCDKTRQVMHTIPYKCCTRINKEFLCPSCGSRPIEGMMCRDGGSSICSNDNCGKKFHYCKNTRQVMHTIPLECCIQYH